MAYDVRAEVGGIYQAGEVTLMGDGSFRDSPRGEQATVLQQ